MNIFEKKSQQIVDQQLKNISTGHLRVQLPTSAEKIYGKIQEAPCSIKVIDYSFFTRLVAFGDIGLGEAWLDRDWVSTDVTGVLELLFRNRPFQKGIGQIGRFKYELDHAFGRDHATNMPNTQMGYDLSDEFYEQMLDEKTMMSSSALFTSSEESLSAAQLRKTKKIIELSDLKKDHHVLEIGCGRAGFAIELAKTIGCRITGTTTSEAEYRYARAQIEKEGVSDLVSIELCEELDIPGTFDRIISIESIETIGRTDIAKFYEACNRLLNVEGRIIQQIVTVPDQFYEANRRNPTWLQRTVFPGGEIPSLTELTKTITRQSDFSMNRLENISNHYGETLRRWRTNFDSNKKELVKNGYDGTFQRKWSYFLSYCEAAFQAGTMNNHHIVFSRLGETSS